MKTGSQPPVTDGEADARRGARSALAADAELCPDCGAHVSGDGISIDETACFRCKGD